MCKVRLTLLNVVVVLLLVLLLLVLLLSLSWELRTNRKALCLLLLLLLESLPMYGGSNIVGWVRLSEGILALANRCILLDTTNTEDTRNS